MSREALIAKIASRVPDEAILKLASAYLSVQDVEELYKEARFAPTPRPQETPEDAADGILSGVGNVLGGVLSAGKHVAGMPSDIEGDPESGVLGRVGESLRHVGNVAVENPKTSLPLAAALAYLLHRGLSRGGGGPPPPPGGAAGAIGVPAPGPRPGPLSATAKVGSYMQPEISEFDALGVTAPVRAQLDKIAQDPAVWLAVEVLRSRGL